MHMIVNSASSVLMLTCSPGHSTETPLADIVAHLTAKHDNEVCFSYCC